MFNPDNMSNHHHSYNNSHIHHNHAPQVNAVNCRAVGIAALITGSFMGLEFIGGHISGSLALIADAGHMLIDFAALIIAWLAFQISDRKAHSENDSIKKLPLYAAAFNVISLFLIAIWIIWEAYERFNNPAPILGKLMALIAVTGLIINLIVLRILAKADGNNLNIKAVYLHVMGDLLGSFAAIIASIAILTKGWTIADPILSVIVAILLLRGAWFTGREIVLEFQDSHWQSKSK